MSFKRQPALTPDDERHLLVRTMVVACAPGVSTTSPTKAWHRLVAAGDGVMIVRTPHGAWSTPASNAVWAPAGARYELEICTPTSLRMLYVRPRRGVDLPTECCVVAVSPLLREVVARISTLSAVDQRIPWHLALARLLTHEIASGARAPHELVWPRDARIASIAARVQAEPASTSDLASLCRGHGVSVRTAQRLFPLETGQTFEEWRKRFRLLHAIRLVSDGHGVKQVAKACGYRSQSAFVAAFRGLAGSTPGALRRRVPCDA